jgi:hypothetical protein
MTQVEKAVDEMTYDSKISVFDKIYEIIIKDLQELKVVKKENKQSQQTKKLSIS